MRITTIRPLTALAALTAGAALVHRLAVLPRIRHWGATDAEISAALPGDELVPDARAQSTIAVTIDAPPEAVWPWLVQMGVDRAGFYSYTWVENGLLRLGVTNAGSIVPEWQDTKVGDRLWFTPEDYLMPRFGPVVMAIEPHRSLVLCLGDPDKPFPGTWQFVLEERSAGSTRLIMRSRSSRETPLLVRLSDLVLEPGYLIMSRKMLLGIKQRSESIAHGQGRRQEAVIDAGTAEAQPPTSKDGRPLEPARAERDRTGVTP